MNKDAIKNIKEAVILEVDRYISCATTNQEREKAYPRKLLEQRLIEKVAQVLEATNATESSDGERK